MAVTEALDQAVMVLSEESESPLKWVTALFSVRFVDSNINVDFFFLFFSFFFLTECWTCVVHQLASLRSGKCCSTVLSYGGWICPPAVPYRAASNVYTTVLLCWPLFERPSNKASMTITNSSKTIETSVRKQPRITPPPPDLCFLIILYSIIIITVI
jgi:hypothetical protein